MDATMDAAAAANGPVVIVHPQAYCVIALHAAQHKNESVHGLLLGTFEQRGQTTVPTAVVSAAVPVAHGAPPTQPLVEVALGLVEKVVLGQTKKDEDSSTLIVIGWYTAPMLLKDTQPGPVALRMLASLATNTSSFNSPVLVVLQNEAFGAMMHGDDESQVLKAIVRGGDLGVVVQDSLKAARATREAVQQGLLVEDFVEHLERAHPSDSSWPQCLHITELINKY